MSFVLKTTCGCSSRLKRRYYSENYFRNKAVSDGAISFYLDHFVSSRVSKWTYGIFGDIEYDPSAADHRSRPHMLFTSFSGTVRICDFFDIILPKVICLVNFLKSMLLKKTFICRIPKFRRRRNSESPMARLRILKFISEVLVFLFGVTVETS